MYELKNCLFHEKDDFVQYHRLKFLFMLLGLGLSEKCATGKSAPIYQK